MPCLPTFHWPSHKTRANTKGTKSCSSNIAEVTKACGKGCAKDMGKKLGQAKELQILGRKKLNSCHYHLGKHFFSLISHRILQTHWNPLHFLSPAYPSTFQSFCLLSGFSFPYDYPTISEYSYPFPQTRISECPWGKVIFALFFSLYLSVSPD